MTGESEDEWKVLLGMRNDIQNILHYISGEYQCSVAKAQSEALIKISQAIEILTEQQGQIRTDLHALQDTIFGREGDKTDTGLKGTVANLVQEMKMIKWIGGIVAGTGLAALVTYWLQILLQHSPYLK